MSSGVGEFLDTVRQVDESNGSVAALEALKAHHDIEAGHGQALAVAVVGVAGQPGHPELDVQGEARGVVEVGVGDHAEAPGLHEVGVVVVERVAAAG